MLTDAQRLAREGKLTLARLKVVLRYNRRSGEFRWKSCPHNTFMIGKVAGAKVGMKRDHLRICIDGIDHYAHRLAWFYVYGKWPKGRLDHKNNRGLDNWISNLRPATYAQNRINAGVPKNNSTGLKGVAVHARGKYGTFTARIGVKGKRIHLGLFKDGWDAHVAYMAAAKKYYGPYARRK